VTERARQIDGAADLLDVGAHDVHAHAAARIGLCDAYVCKPVDLGLLLEQLKSLELPV
jgi:hypothetical protein